MECRVRKDQPKDAPQMILHIRITEDPLDSNGPRDSLREVEHYHRRVELSDAEAVARIGRALDAELGKPTRKPRSDRGTTRATTT